MIGGAAPAIAEPDGPSTVTERRNAASRAVMERLGMTYAGEITAEGLVEGSDQARPDAPFAVYVTGPEVDI